MGRSPFDDDDDNDDGGAHDAATAAELLSPVGDTDLASLDLTAADWEALVAQIDKLDVAMAHRQFDDAVSSITEGATMLPAA